MKKLIITGLIASILASNIPLQAGTTAKKVGASAKIVCGILGLPTSVFLAYKGITLKTIRKQQRHSKLPQHSAHKTKHQFHNLLGAISILPLSIIAIQSGVNDLRNIKSEGITV